MSLALTLSPARAHRTTEPSGGSCTPTQPQPALPTSNFTVVYCGFMVNLIKSNSYKQEHELELNNLTQRLSGKQKMTKSEIIVWMLNTSIIFYYSEIDTFLFIN